MVSFEQALQEASRIHAPAYVECSAVTGEGIQNAFETCVRVALNWKPSKSDPYNQVDRLNVNEILKRIEQAKKEQKSKLVLNGRNIIENNTIGKGIGHSTLSEMLKFIGKPCSFKEIQLKSNFFKF